VCTAKEEGNQKGEEIPKHLKKRVTWGMGNVYSIRREERKRNEKRAKKERK